MEASPCPANGVVQRYDCAQYKSLRSLFTHCRAVRVVVTPIRLALLFVYFVGRQAGRQTGRPCCTRSMCKRRTCPDAPPSAATTAKEIVSLIVFVFLSL